MQRLEDLKFQIRPGQHGKTISNRKKGEKIRRNFATMEETCIHKACMLITPSPSTLAQSLNVINITSLPGICELY